MNNNKFSEGDTVYYFRYLNLIRGEVAEVQDLGCFVGLDFILSDNLYQTKADALYALVKYAAKLAEGL